MIWTMVLAIAIAAALPFLFEVVVWAIIAIFYPICAVGSAITTLFSTSDAIVDLVQPSRRPLFPSGRKGVLVFLGLYVAAAVAAYFVVSHH